ncbi:hypothetical protein ACFW3D_16180 [Streptomyces sp. NPDC058864]
MEEAVPLGRGDVRWVFPDPGDIDAVREALVDADEHVSRLAGQLGVQAGHTGGGLEYHRVDGFVLAGVFGSVELPAVSFHARLYFPRRCLWDLNWGPPWEVEAEVRVPCDRGTDCGGHTVAETGRSYDTPVDSARALVRVTTWLLAQGAGRPPGAWRSHDPGSPSRTVR